MDEITAYKTRDGRIFELAAEARAHQAELAFEAWYESDDNALYGVYAGSRVDVSIVKDWLRENSAQVLTFLGRT